MYAVNEIKELYDRLKAQYPRYEMTFSGDALTITLLYGKAEVNCEGAKLYANGKLYDQFTSDEVDNPDDLYELIEAFFIQFQQLGMECGNETYIAAKTKAARLGTRFMFLMSLIVTACIFAVYLTHSLWWMLAVFVCPVAAFIPMGMIHKQTFRKYWVCPECGKPLPLNKKERFPRMEYVSQCPHCGYVLEKAPEMEPFQLDSDAPQKQLGPADDLPAPGKKWPCFLTGGITTVMTLLLFPMLFVADEPLDPAGVAVAVVLLLVLLGFGLVLLLCRHTEPEELRQPVVVLRERKIVAVCGGVVWVFGFVVMLAAICVAGTPPFEAGFTLFLALAGVPLTLLGVWMLLAQRNRALFVFRDNSIMYISSWGRVRNFEPGQVASVRMTVNQSMHLLDQNGKKLASVETNMQGAYRFAEWIESIDLTATLTPTMEQQAVREAEKESIVQWREEYRTPLHDHLGAIRVGLVLVILLLAAGNMVPYLLYLFTDLKISHAIYLTAFSPVPMILYYIAFAPVFLVGDRPAGATDEWKSMHIKFPVTIVALLALLMLAQVYYFWEERILKIVDFGPFFLLWVGITALLIGLFWVRTPKRMHAQDGFVMIILSLVVMGFALTYGVNLAISRPVEHYPAVVVDRQAPTEENEDADHTLTVLLDDGTTTEINVSKRLYDLEEAGVEFVVCQKENFLGIRMARLHLPAGTDTSTLPETDDTTP